MDGRCLSMSGSAQLLYQFTASQLSTQTIINIKLSAVITSSGPPGGLRLHRLRGWTGNLVFQPRFLCTGLLFTSEMMNSARITNFTLKSPLNYSVFSWSEIFCKNKIAKQYRLTGSSTCLANNTIGSIQKTHTAHTELQVAEPDFIQWSMFFCLFAHLFYVH